MSAELLAWRTGGIAAWCYPGQRQRRPVAVLARLAHPREDDFMPLLIGAGAAADDAGRLLLDDHVMKAPMASNALRNDGQND